MGRIVMKRIITPAMFLSAQIATATGAHAVLDDAGHDDGLDDSPRTDVEVLAKAPAAEQPHVDAWWVLHTVGRGCVVLHH
jgi:hypothetical protein